MTPIGERNYGWTLDDNTVRATDEHEAARLLAEAMLVEFNAAQENGGHRFSVSVQQANRNDWLAHFTKPPANGIPQEFVREFKVFVATSPQDGRGAS